MAGLNAERIIGLDIGTNCGYAYTQGRRIHPALSGVWNLAPSSSTRFEGGGMRFVRFEKQLQELLQSVDYDAIVYFEEVKRHGRWAGGKFVSSGTAAGHVFGGFMAVLAVVCEAHDVPYEGLSVGEIKNTATGKGNASKKDMIAAASRRWGSGGEAGVSWVPEEDQADALWVLHCGLARLGIS